MVGEAEILTWSAPPQAEFVLAERRPDEAAPPELIATGRRYSSRWTCEEDGTSNRTETLFRLMRRFGRTESWRAEFDAHVKRDAHLLRFEVPLLNMYSPDGTVRPPMGLDVHATYLRVSFYGSKPATSAFVSAREKWRTVSREMFEAWSRGASPSERLPAGWRFVGSLTQGPFLVPPETHRSPSTDYLFFAEEGSETVSRFVAAWGEAETPSHGLFAFRVRIEAGGVLVSCDYGDDRVLQSLQAVTVGDGEVRVIAAQD